MSSFFLLGVRKVRCSMRSWGRGGRDKGAVSCCRLPGGFRCPATHLKRCRNGGKELCTLVTAASQGLWDACRDERELGTSSCPGSTGTTPLQGWCLSQGTSKEGEANATHRTAGEAVPAKLVQPSLAGRDSRLPQLLASRQRQAPAAPPADFPCE